MKPRDCPQCGWPLAADGSDAQPSHLEMHDWWEYWMGLTKEEREQEWVSMAEYAAVHGRIPR